MEIVSVTIAWMLMAPIIWWINRAVARAEERQAPVKRVLPENVVDLEGYRHRVADDEERRAKRSTSNTTSTDA